MMTDVDDDYNDNDDDMIIMIMIRMMIIIENRDSVWNGREKGEDN